jgi:chromosome segregation ATPase
MKNLPPNASKNEEIEFIKEVAAIVPAGSYVSQLLNKQLLEWFEQNVRKDYVCDIIRELELAQDDKQEQSDRAEDAKEALDKAMERIQHMVPVAVLTDCEAARNEFQRQAQSNEERAIKYSNDLTAAEGKITTLTGRVSRRDNEILHLKAEIYDIRAIMESVIAVAMEKQMPNGLEDFIREQLEKVRKNAGK